MILIFYSIGMKNINNLLNKFRKKEILRTKKNLQILKNLVIMLLLKNTFN